MTRSANRSVSTTSPCWNLAANGPGDSPTVSVGSPIDSIMAVHSVASCADSTMRSLKISDGSSPAMPMVRDTLSSAARGQLAQFGEFGVGDGAADPPRVCAEQGAGGDAQGCSAGVLGG